MILAVVLVVSLCYLIYIRLSMGETVVRNIITQPFNYSLDYSSYTLPNKLHIVEGTILEQTNSFYFSLFLGKTFIATDFGKALLVSRNLLKSSKKYPVKDRLSRLLFDVGGNIEVQEQNGSIVLVGNFQTQHFKEIMEVLIDGFNNPLFPIESI